MKKLIVLIITVTSIIISPTVLGNVSEYRNEDKPGKENRSMENLKVVKNRIKNLNDEIERDFESFIQSKTSLEELTDKVYFVGWVKTLLSKTSFLREEEAFHILKFLEDSRIKEKLKVDGEVVSEKCKLEAYETTCDEGYTSISMDLMFVELLSSI